MRTKDIAFEWNRLWNIHNNSLWIMENNTLKVYHERRVLGSQESLVQKSVEALAGGSSTVEDGKEKNTIGGYWIECIGSLGEAEPMVKPTDHFPLPICL